MPGIGGIILYYTVRAFVEEKDARLDVICRTFCSMERTAYGLLRKGEGVAAVKARLRLRYRVINERWIQSIINQASAVAVAQKEGIAYRVDVYKEKAKNTEEKSKHLSDQVKIQGCKRKVSKLQRKIYDLKIQLQNDSYPPAVFGSRELLHKLAIARGERKKELRDKWRMVRSNHFFSVGQANQRGNANIRLCFHEANSFSLEIRNWSGGDFTLPLRVPDYWNRTLKSLIERSRSVKLGRRGELLEGSEGQPYTVRVIKSEGGYQVLVSFDISAPEVTWGGRLAGIDVNPEGIACTITSEDGNLVATRFFGDHRFVTAAANKRKWILENTAKKMLEWCKNNHRCQAVAVEDLELKGAYDSNAKVNSVLSNFVRSKMLKRIRLSALKLNMLSVLVNPAYSSMVASAKYADRFGGFNRHQLAAFVIARRALGYGERPVFACMPRTRRERSMWNGSIRFYGHQSPIQTSPRREPLERKNGGDANGKGAMTKLLKAPPAITSSQVRLSHALFEEERSQPNPSIGERGGSAQTAIPAGETELEGIELTLPTPVDVGKPLTPGTGDNDVS